MNDLDFKKFEQKDFMILLYMQVKTMAMLETLLDELGVGYSAKTSDAVRENWKAQFLKISERFDNRVHPLKTMVNSHMELP